MSKGKNLTKKLGSGIVKAGMLIAMDYTISYIIGAEPILSGAIKDPVKYAKAFEAFLVTGTILSPKFNLHPEGE